jgi:hypothetical protein
MPIIGLAVLTVAVVGSTSWTVRLIRAGMRDSLDLTAKLEFPNPRRAADWPELRLDAVVFDPGGANRVLLAVRWPAHPDPRALLMLEVEESPARAQRLFAAWHDSDASVSPRALEDERLLLRRRHSNRAVSARVVSEWS